GADLDLGIGLAVALTLPVALLGGVLEDAHLLALAVLHHSGGHGSALHSGSAEGGVVPVQHSQNLIEHDLLAGLGLQLLDEQSVALRHLVLLAAGNDDCLHVIQLLYYGLALTGGERSHFANYPAQSGSKIISVSPFAVK